MSRLKYMRLTEGPAEIATTTRKVWSTLFVTYGWQHFNPIEARGALRIAHEFKTSAEAQRFLDVLVDRGFAVYTIEELTEP